MGDEPTWSDLPPEPPKPPAPPPSRPPSDESEPGPNAPGYRPPRKNDPNDMLPGEVFGDHLATLAAMRDKTEDAAPAATHFSDDVADMVKGKGCGLKMAGLVLLVAILIVLFVVFAATRSGDSPAKKLDATTTTTTAAPAAGAKFPAPAESGLAPGEILFKGAGSPIGFIAQDGKSRFLSLDHPGVVAGDALAQGQAHVMTVGGTVTSFGANLGISVSRGRYGVAVFDVRTRVYKAGCAIEIGHAGCTVKSQNGGVLTKGESVVIIVGEAGNMGATGDYGLDWWFVLKPDA